MTAPTPSLIDQQRAARRARAARRTSEQIRAQWAEEDRRAETERYHVWITRERARAE
jgi:hypothetical protein